MLWSECVFYGFQPLVKGGKLFCRIAEERQDLAQRPAGDHLHRRSGNVWPHEGIDARDHVLQGLFCLLSLRQEELPVQEVEGCAVRSAWHYAVTGSQSDTVTIRLRADGLSFYGCSTANAATVETEHYTCAEGERMADTLERAIAQSTLLRQGAPGVVYGLASGPSMQIPLECFRKEEVHALYRLTYAQEKTGKTYYNILPHLEIAQIFTIDTELEQLLLRHFPGMRFYHGHTMVLEKMWLLETQGLHRLYAYFHEQEIFVFAYREQRLAYANSFPADVAENAVYFLLSVWKDLKMDAQQGECVLIGEHGIKDSTAQLLSKYLAHVKETQATEIFRRSSLARDPQVPFDLLALWANVV